MATFDLRRALAAALALGVGLAACSAKQKKAVGIPGGVDAAADRAPGAAADARDVSAGDAGPGDAGPGAGDADSSGGTDAQALEATSPGGPDAGADAALSCVDLTAALGAAVPLYTAADAKTPPIVYKRADGVLITRGAGRFRLRHEKEQTFGLYYPGYFDGRSYGLTIEDFTVVGQTRIRVTYLPIDASGATSCRAWKVPGDNATFMMNWSPIDLATPPVAPTGPVGRVQQCEQTSAPGTRTFDVGENFEFELSTLSTERNGSAYTDTFRYQLGVGGLTSDNRDFDRTPGPLPEARLGGDTTISWLRVEPDMYYSQLALNAQQENVQGFLEGRRLFHTNFITGGHVGEADSPYFPENPVFTEQAGKAGPKLDTSSCVSCHLKGGRGTPLERGVMFGENTSTVFRLTGAPAIGPQLHPDEGSAMLLEVPVKSVAFADGTEVRIHSPVYEVKDAAGAQLAFSARIAPTLVGLGLLEAVDEHTIAGLSDRLDCNLDGISGRVSFAKDPATGALRVGRFGWKAEKVSLSHQVADDAAASLGVATTLVPDATGKAELSDTDLAKLTAFMRLVAVPPQRNADDPVVRAGAKLFDDVGCAGCHVTKLVTSPNHPFAELRNQTIKPYTDLLLHDMGPDLADKSGVPADAGATTPASASEWRTPPLWGVGLRETVNHNIGLLHDGRAPDVQAAILWHGGEAVVVRMRYTALSPADRAALLAFVDSL